MDDIDFIKGFTPNFHAKQNDRLLPGGGDVLIWSKVFLETSEILHFISFYPPPHHHHHLPLLAISNRRHANCGALKALSVRAVQMAERLDLRSEVRLSPSRCLKFHSGVSILVDLR